ncbi:hypothetical protein ACWD7C_06520 [Streptomyces sp. NPDC005134]|uniref:hypothetical protein n=1 Tax=Streptomyces sp. NPDC005098 TaxID=3154560 RepID=UPI0033BC408F
MSHEPRQILLETAPLDRPDRDQGLGRYTRSLASAYAAHGVDITPFGRASTSKRSREIPLALRDYAKLGLKTRAAYANAKRADRSIVSSMHTSERVSDLPSIPWQKNRVWPLPVSQSFEAPAEPSCSKSKYVSALVDLRTPDPRKRSHWLEPVARRVKERGATLGAPIVASDIAVYREILGGRAWFVDPADPGSIAAGIQSALGWVDSVIVTAAGREALLAAHHWADMVLSLRSELIGALGLRGRMRTGEPLAGLTIDRLDRRGQYKVRRENGAERL